MAENGGEARSSFIEKGILYTVSQFLSSLKQYRLYVRVGKHMCYLLIRGLEWGIVTAVPCPTDFEYKILKMLKFPWIASNPPPPLSGGKH